VLLVGRQRGCARAVCCEWSLLCDHGRLCTCVYQHGVCVVCAWHRIALLHCNSASCLGPCEGSVTSTAAVVLIKGWGGGCILYVLRGVSSIAQPAACWRPTVLCFLSQPVASAGAASSGACAQGLVGMHRPLPAHMFGCANVDVDCSG
jgi:hypothetical protein